MDAATVLLLAQLTGANAPPTVETDPSGFNSGNVTAATAITKAWSMLPGTPVAGTVYRLRTEFTGTWEGNAMAFDVAVAGSWTQFSPAVAAGSFSNGAVIAGWLVLTVRVLTATTARFALAGAVSETATSVSPGSGSAPLAPLSQTLAVAGGDTLALGVLFGASTSGQGIATYGSDFETASP